MEALVGPPPVWHSVFARKMVITLSAKCIAVISNMSIAHAATTVAASADIVAVALLSSTDSCLACLDILHTFRSRVMKCNFFSLHRFRLVLELACVFLVLHLVSDILPFSHLCHLKTSLVKRVFSIQPLFAKDY